MKASSGGVRDRGSDLICASSLSSPVRHNYPIPALSGTSNNTLCLCLWQPYSFHCCTHACTFTIKNQTCTYRNNYIFKSYFSLCSEANSLQPSYNQISVGWRPGKVLASLGFWVLQHITSLLHFMHTHIYVWGFPSVRLFPLISINGLDLPSFISTFFSSPEAFDIQPVDIKNSGLNFSPSLFASVAVERSLNTGVQIWYDMQTQLQKTWVPFQINFFFRDDLKTINSPALRLYHPVAQGNQHAQTIWNTLSSLHGCV